MAREVDKPDLAGGVYLISYVSLEDDDDVPKQSQ